MIAADPCAICAHPDPRDLHRALVHWRDAPQGMAYSHVIRCRDVGACKRRLTGKPWPLVEEAGDHARQREAS